MDYHCVDDDENEKKALCGKVLPIYWNHVIVGVDNFYHNYTIEKCPRCLRWAKHIVENRKCHAEVHSQGGNQEKDQKTESIQ